jgi:hypothetical protein
MIGFGAVIPALIPLIDRLIPDPNQASEAKLRAIEMAQKGEHAQIDAEIRLALGQMEVNKVEASTDLFRGGWRPATGWACVAGLGYQFLLQPILPWFVNLFGLDVPALPEIDGDALMVLLTGMLGLGGLRTYERIKGKV